MNDCGQVYCFSVIDVNSRKIFGWVIDTREPTGLVLNVLDMAGEAMQFRQRVIASGHGTQFTPKAFR